MTSVKSTRDRSQRDGENCPFYAWPSRQAPGLVHPYSSSSTISRISFHSRASRDLHFCRDFLFRARKSRFIFQPNSAKFLYPLHHTARKLLSYPQPPLGQCPSDKRAKNFSHGAESCRTKPSPVPRAGRNACHGGYGRLTPPCHPGSLITRPPSIPTSLVVSHQRPCTPTRPLCIGETPAQLTVIALR